MELLDNPLPAAAAQVAGGGRGSVGGAGLRRGAERSGAGGGGAGLGLGSGSARRVSPGGSGLGEEGRGAAEPPELPVLQLRLPRRQKSLAALLGRLKPLVLPPPPQPPNAS